MYFSLVNSSSVSMTWTLFGFDAKGRVLVYLDWLSLGPVLLQPWMAMTIGVFIILGVFRVYVWRTHHLQSRLKQQRLMRQSSGGTLSTGGGSGSGGGGIYQSRRKDSIVDPILLIKQMINTKPKRFADIFPEELKELAKRRVNVLHEKDPFKISSLFPLMRRSSTSSALSTSRGISTPPGLDHPGSNSLNKKKVTMFRTPQTLRGSQMLQKEPSPLALSPPTVLPASPVGAGVLVDPINLNNPINDNNSSAPDNVIIPNFITEKEINQSKNQQQPQQQNNNDEDKPKIEPYEFDSSSSSSSDEDFEEESSSSSFHNINVEKNSNNNNSRHHYFNHSSYSGSTTSPKIQPSVDFGLVGLALSGGGIRSATFNLGLLQALAKHKFFRKVDYLSTVSGGGFIGSCLISLLSEGTHTSEWSNFPFHYSRGMKEGVPLKHLRNSANYLANGIFEFMLFPVLILRGIVLNLISIFPFVWALLLFERYVPIIQARGSYYLTLRIAWNLLVHIVIFPLISRPKVTIPAIVFFLTIYHSDISQYFSGVRNIEMIISLVLHLYLNHPWLLRKEDSKVWYDRSFGWLFILLISMGFVESLPIIERHYLYYFGSNDQSFRVYPLISLFALILADSLAFTLLTNPKISPVKRLVFHIIVSVIGPILLILTYLELGVWLDPNAPVFGLGNGICFFVSMLSFFTMDINETSMHKYYRDRLSKAYMFSIRNGRFRPYGGEKVSRINRRSIAPYLIINTTLNYTTSETDDKTDIGMPTDTRGSDFFIFSQHYVGSESCGYRSTEQMEKLDRRLDLATAVSISGAAVGTKMGTATIPTLVLSLGILNIRLGYWLPNPLGIFLRHPHLGRLFYGGFACYHLVKEFGWTHMTSKDWCINLSDGGHIENLGAYELIKRRCKYVIMSDSEADPDMTFPSMAQLMRLVRIDFGINIQINLDDIRRSENGYSSKHWTVGKIIYQKKKQFSNLSTSNNYQDSGDSSDVPPRGEVGYILYIKSSLTGDEDEVIKEYHSQHPSFPHESTTDQFFTESQFEAYRSLGYHIAGSTLFGPKHNRLFDGEDVESFFERIYQSCQGELPSGWQEKKDDSGGQYFVQNETKKSTLNDPRLRSKKTASTPENVPLGMSKSMENVRTTNTPPPPVNITAPAGNSESPISTSSNTKGINNFDVLT
ncbi:patatin family protein [Cavenderia fasciculata]|uniref:Patatin family protein n=1 Tax=Cavenderia fasciculata TaxID=261658 RepID=F4QCL0_CACFS|nr:patatin family protein [Cavenderia fasciculata]EGG14438.1 patatin family protein [Cavenderia fasciculata]|eukprot:XP_004353847.1 patatin family protein [Cavenderia fasciculata]